MSEATPKRCEALRKDGTPCRAPALIDGRWCYAHGSPPDTAAAARSRGGRNRANAARSLKRLPERLRPVADLLADALVEVHRGELDPRRATAMAAVAGALVRTVQAGELEERLAALERKAGIAG